MNPNTEYEIFTQKVYQVLLNADLGRFKTIEVQHDVKLKGRSGQEHQIDVYWKYNIASINHEIIIECKNYSHPVPIGKVRDFYGVISDLNNVSGIMVTKVGYQQGAKKYAETYGIILKELRAPKEGEGIVAEIGINIHICRQRQLFRVDEEWAESHGFDLQRYNQRLDILVFILGQKKWTNATHIPLQTKNDNILNSKGQVISSLKNLRDSLSFIIGNEREKVYKLDDAYVDTLMGVMKIKEIKFEDEEDNQTKTILLDAQELIMAIIKDVQTGESLRVGKL